MRAHVSPKPPPREGGKVPPANPLRSYRRAAVAKPSTSVESVTELEKFS